MTRYFDGARAVLNIGLIASLLLVGASTLQAQDKATVFGQMQNLAQQILALKATASNPAVAAQVEDLRNQYTVLSDQIGGQDPFGLRNGFVPSRHSGAKAAGSQKAAPPAPGTGTATTTNYANNTPTAIPDSGATSSDIIVSSSDTFLLDVDLNLDITHTWNADLNITLTSPAGTTAIISTANGGSNDDVFSGSLIDDFATELITDTTYADGVPATPLVPEGALAAFFGEDPNGTWTLAISDNATQDTGDINSWSLDLTTLGGDAEATVDGNFANNTVTAIPDSGQVSVDVDVSGAGDYLCDLNLTTNITHTWNADLNISLTSPAGTTTAISTANGGSNDDVFAGTVWDDNGPETATDNTYADGVPATSLIPEGALGAFIGEDPNGTWTMTISDNAAQDTGDINSWSLDVTTCSAGGGFGQTPFDIAIPTLGEWGLLALLLALGTAGVMFIRRR